MPDQSDRPDQSGQPDRVPDLDPLIAGRLGPLWDLPEMTMGGPPAAAAVLLEAFNRPYGAPEPGPVTTQALVVPGPHGPIPIRVYRPVDEPAPQPGLVWMHGGAFVLGDLDMPEADDFARGVVCRVPSVVVSVDYRLAVGGVRFPIPHDDVVAAFRWVAAHGAELGIDSSRLAIGGASAGANLAAGAALRLRDDAGPLPSQVLLAYPVVHPVVPPPSPGLQAALRMIPPVLRFSPALLAALNENYLGAGLVDASPYAFAARADDLRGYPPTLIENSEFDDLRPSGEAFAEALAAAGVDVELEMQPGVPHGHLNQRGLPAQRQSLDRFAARLRR